ncbi:MAG TPA: FeoB-associated Cys-rich membrane protein [Clostridia bacterium]|jgi:ethanolamine transporter EutH
MTPADIVILVLVSLAVVGAIAYIVRNKIRSKRQGVRSCPGCDACKYIKKSEK